MGLHRCEITVRYCETDQMGIVHHSRYYPWFEVGRSEYFEDNSMSYQEMESLGVALPLIESHCRYYTGAKYMDRLEIITQMTLLTPSKVKFEYEVVRKADNKLLAGGYTLHAFASGGKAVNLKKHNEKMWEKILRLSGLSMME